MKRAVVAAILAAMTACAPPREAFAADTISFSDLLVRPRAAAEATIAYGPGPQQFGELWLPKG